LFCPEVQYFVNFAFFSLRFLVIAWKPEYLTFATTYFLVLAALGNPDRQWLVRELLKDERTAMTDNEVSGGET
jgi:hypothetical protein